MTTPRRHRIAVFAAIAVLLALAATLALRVYSAARLERALARFDQAGGLDFVSLAPAPVEPRKENAAFWLRSGADVLIAEDDSAVVKRRLAALGSPWTNDDVEAFERLRAQNQEARRLMDHAIDLERSSFELDYTRGADVEIPDFLRFLRAARYVSIDCDFHQQRGEMAEALASLRLLERITAIQRAEPMLISLLTGAATERAYLDRLEAMLRDVRDPQTLRALARDLDRLDAATLPAARVVGADVSATYRVFLRDGSVYAENVPASTTSRVWHRFHPLIWATGVDQLTAAVYLETGTRAVESLTRPVAAMSPEEYQRDVLLLGSLPPGVGNPARQITPNYQSAIQREQWTRDARALARLALELSLSRAGHGAYPPALASLPVSSATGEKATYTVLPDGGVEIAFPEAESTSASETERTSKRPGVITVAAINLRWRLRP